MTSAVDDEVLAAAHELAGGSGQPFSTRAVSSRARISVARAGAVLRELRRRDLVRRGHGGALHLTADGLARSGRLARRRRLARGLLIEFLGIDGAAAAGEVSRVAAAFSDTTEELVAALLERGREGQR